MAGCKRIDRNSSIINALEKFFNWWGNFVTSHPKLIITCALIVTAIASLGFLKIRMERKNEELWLPHDHHYNRHLKWLEEHFQQDVRNEIILINSDNMLTSEGLLQMYTVHKSIQNISANGKSFEDLCMRIPIGDIFRDNKRKKREAYHLKNFTKFDYGQSALLPLSSKYTLADEEFGDYDYEFTFEDYDDRTPSEEIRIDNRSKWRKFINYSSRYNGELPDQIYCDVVTTLHEVCLQRSLLEIWQYNPIQILAATQQDILDAVNLLSVSPQFSCDYDFSSSLGGIKRNRTGHIIGASTVIMYWGLKIPQNADVVTGNGGGFGGGADNFSLTWEKEFIERTINMTFENVTVLPFANRSFGDVVFGALFFDFFKLIAGYIVMFIFTVCMLGRLNILEVRWYLSIAGISGIVMAVIISYGTCSFAGFSVTPMSALLPFVLLGIGIDDMFVIMQSFSNLEKDPNMATMSLENRVGLALQHAGVAITVTSLTDILAFAIGSISDMPGLVSFCVSGAIGLLAVYLLSISWFVAWLYLDQLRISQSRNGLVPCLKLEELKPPPCSNYQWIESLFSKLMDFLSFNVYKVVVVFVTVSLFGIGIWGSISIRREFDWVLMMPSDSYLRRLLDLFEEEYYQEDLQYIPDFPFYWATGYVYTGHFDHTQLENMEYLVNQLKYLEHRGEYIGGLDSWWEEMKEYAKDYKNLTDWRSFSSKNNFSEILSDFLFSSKGIRFQLNFKFDRELICNHPAPEIMASRFSITYQKQVMDEASLHIPAKNAISNIIRAANFSTKSFAHLDLIYFVWDNEEILQLEMWRNMGLAMISVFVTTLLLLANLPISLMVILCVTLTIVDTIGFLHFWNVKIYFVSMIYVVVAIGLCVDYSVHIAYAYLVSKGSRLVKSTQAVQSIGPAVLNGGITTFLAVILLGFSTTSMTDTFFKVVFLTVIFGLFNGLIFFPVLLSVIGPSEQDVDKKKNETNAENISNY